MGIELIHDPQQSRNFPTIKIKNSLIRIKIGNLLKLILIIIIISLRNNFDFDS